MERLENFKVQLIIVIAAQVLAVVLLFMFDLQQIAFTVACVVLVNVMIEFWIMNRMEKEKKNTDLDITRALGRDAKDALVFGGVGIITYDEQYCATWVSELLEERGVDLVGKKLSSWISGITELFNTDGREVVIGQSGDRVYEITHKEDTQLLYVRDITELFNLRQEKHNNGIVVGLLRARWAGSRADCAATASWSCWMRKFMKSWKRRSSRSSIRCAPRRRRWMSPSR